jgi:hypothetical protein
MSENAIFFENVRKCKVKKLGNLQKGGGVSVQPAPKISRICSDNFVVRHCV